jgi:small ligand-binding sensory domain FIST
VSQGCRPIGRPYVVTKAEQNLIEELAGKPAMERLQELAAAATEDERELLRQGLHVGLVVDEHKADFARGDFLVRNLLGADEQTGALAVGEQVGVGQTVQFHVRDAAAADEDLRELLADADADAALLFTCNGRGRHLFGVADHDAGLVEKLLGPIPLAGAFCAGEIGPVGGRNFLHGFTASLALFA